MSTTTAYRIEKRFGMTGHQITFGRVCLDPESLQPLTAERGFELMQQMIRDHKPYRYGPHSGYRLVLVGPPACRPSLLSPHRWGWRR